MLFIFFNAVLIRHLRQLKTAVFQHWCLICAVLFFNVLDPFVSYTKMKCYEHDPGSLFTLYLRLCITVSEVK